MNPRLRILLLAVVVAAALTLLIWILSGKNQTKPVTPVALPPAGEPRDAPPAQPATPATTPDPALSPSPALEATATPTPTPSPAASPNATPAPAASPAPTMNFPTPYPRVSTPNNSSSSGGKLSVPVEGIRPEQLQDTYSAARSEGRVHNAIDIIAPRGTPVLAVADGTVVKLFNSKPGGITIYQLADDNRHVFYYAHLDRYADNLREGQRIQRGQTIAYVGDTGNAGAGNYHLHFSVSLISDPKRYWDGVNINPYPLMTQR
ncbi:MAG TPA: M23 family metallopeptidase [Pyrinomonadaceae bacterium]|jgi:murein DD-endopeptidase MepM/ murein hydrolase activator NlpD|nr:M23 family metallopeptidase [Pyrinomonadaceae bacterium]